MGNENNIVICAAGVGSRLGINKPKCLLEIEGRPLIHWQLDLLEDFKRIIVIIGFQYKKVMETILKKRSDIIFVLNSDYLNTNTLYSLRLGASKINEPFISLDGDLLVVESALKLIAESPCPTIGVKKTYSEEPVCVTIETNNNKKLVTSFSRDIMDYEWTGLAKIHPEHLKTKNDAKYIYEALEYILPINCVEVDCFEIDTKQDFQRAKKWMKKRNL